MSEQDIIEEEKSAIRNPQSAIGESAFVAVDLGAGSGRVFLSDVSSEKFALDEIRRFQYPPQVSDGHLRWDFPKIFDEIKVGLREASERARELGKKIESIGVDSWGVDYGLIDADGKLVENPICYRDERTQGAMEKVFAHVSRDEIFASTGIQFMPFNTLFQLYVHAQEGIDTSLRLLLIPDLINFFLTGKAVTEFTNATTTQMVNAETGTWDKEMLERLNIPSKLLAEIVSSGAYIGKIKDELADELNLDDVRVVAPATHDTGSAVVGAPLETGFAYISSGTWSLVGIEKDKPLINADVARHNFTNEGGAFGTFRFLKNVMGLWILESCRKEWKERGLDVDYENLLNQIAAIDDYPAFIFPDDARLFNPPSMLETIAQQLKESGQTVSDNPAIVTKIILDSLAFRYASVLKTIESLTQQKINGVQIVGGGSRNDYLNQMTANATGLNVIAGPIEATVTGNVIVQAIAAGRFESLQEARRYVAQNIELKKFTPRTSYKLEEAARCYKAIEARYV
jgi:rhamnulokinase